MILLKIGRGEICLRGPNVFKGYYKDPAKTSETIDKDGWLHTGDVGIFLADGKLKIVDRKKNIFKLSQGEYVAAEKIENVYLKSSLVAQNFVHGDSMQSCLVAIIVLDPDQVPVWAEKNGLGGKSWKTKRKNVSKTLKSITNVDILFPNRHFYKFDQGLADLSKDPKLKKAIIEDITKIGRANKLLGYEIAKDIYLEATAWTPEDILTPTFKLQRRHAKEKYKDQIAEMYNRIGDVPGSKM